MEILAVVGLWDNNCARAPIHSASHSMIRCIFK